MRIIAGEWKGRRITAPMGMAVRPTPERVREAWMSILQNEIPGSRVLDVFAGTGALGLEALSRGAERADFVESDPRSLRVLERNIASLGAEGRCTIHRTDGLAFVRDLSSPPAGRSPLALHPTDFPVHPPPSVCFADPPYRRGLAGELVGLWLAAPFSTILGVEHESTETLPEGGDRRRYGDTALTIYRT